ncbi:hypothetical protein PENTCL1PPCAC_5612, partial [Pristionchus entomophagus]
MIYLIAAMILMPLLLLGCIRRGTEKPEKTRLPYSNMGTTAPPAVISAREGARTPPPPAAPAPAATATPPPPLLPQPAPDGAKDTGGTSTTKRPGSGESDNTTDKKREQQTPSVGSGEKLHPLAPSRPRSFHSFMQRRSRSRDKRRNSPLTGTREPMRRTARIPNKRMVTPPPGSKKSKKSRKAMLPKSPSWKEVAARTRATPTQSKTDVTAQAKTPIAQGNVQSMCTAVSEASFRDNTHKV